MADATNPTTSPNPQNLNQSPSPGGDGIQSSQSERTAAGLDKTVNQPGQQRVNAAERREKGEATKHDDKAGLRPSVIQSPGEVLPGEAAAEAINNAEAARLKAAEEAHGEFAGRDLPQATVNELEAGKAALKRHAPPAQPTNPVDATSTTSPVNPDKA